MDLDPMVLSVELDEWEDISRWLKHFFGDVDWGVEAPESHREIFKERLDWQKAVVPIGFLAQFWYTVLRGWYTQLSAG